MHADLKKIEIRRTGQTTSLKNIVTSVSPYFEGSKSLVCSFNYSTPFNYETTMGWKTRSDNQFMWNRIPHIAMYNLSWQIVNNDEHLK